MPLFVIDPSNFSAALVNVPLFVIAAVIIPAPVFVNFPSFVKVVD